jgi:hypothetical protein
LAQAADLNMNATAANRGLPRAGEHLNGENVRRSENAVARQRFGPLQDPEFFIFFWGVRWRAGIPAQEGLSNAFTANFPIAAAIRTEPLLPSAALDFAPTASAGYRRVTSRCFLSARFRTIAVESGSDYFGHEQFL